MIELVVETRNSTRLSNRHEESWNAERSRYTVINNIIPRMEYSIPHCKQNQ